MTLNRTRFLWTAVWITILFKEAGYGSTISEIFQGAGAVS